MNRWDSLAALTAAASLCGCPRQGGTTGGAEETATNADDGEAEATDGDALTGRCRATCEQPVDCCAPGTPDCPGDYPNDWSCEAGFCLAAGCKADENCTLGAPESDFECHPIEGVGRCFIPCEAQGGCTAIPGSACEGMADDGAKFCQVICTSDEDCVGAGVCAPDGQCRCGSDDDCSADGLSCDI